jgi:hypothetical protein
METILDTFPAFLAYWKEFRNRNQEDQIDGWRYIYMADWPELLNKQIDEYESEGVRWRDIAGKNVFPELEQRFPDMQTAYSNLLDVLPTTLTKAIRLLEYEGELAAVIYVGIGLGAGWATTYAGLPAILLGLENIAECGWISKEALVGLIAHELGHRVHFWRREQANVAKGIGPWWQLYSEGLPCEASISSWVRRAGICASGMVEMIGWGCANPIDHGWQPSFSMPSIRNNQSDLSLVPGTISRVIGRLDTISDMSSCAF